MPEQIEMDASEGLLDLVFVMADHGMKSMNALGLGESFTPFAIVDDGRGRKLIRFSAEFLEDGLNKAREYVLHNRSDIAVYGIAHDGYVTIRGEKSDAVLIEAGETGCADAYIFTQRYKPNTGSGINDPTGNLAFMGKVASRLVP